MHFFFSSFLLRFSLSVSLFLSFVPHLYLFIYLSIFYLIFFSFSFKLSICIFFLFLLTSLFPIFQYTRAHSLNVSLWRTMLGVTYTYIFSLSPSRPSLLPFHIRMYIYAKYRWKHARVYDVLCCIVRLVANGRVCRVHFQIFSLFKYEKNILHKRNMNISRSELFMRHFISFYFYFIFIPICLYKYLLY